MVKVFLSHSYFDEKFAEVIHKWISETFKGIIKVYRSSDQDSMTFGSNIKDQVMNALQESTVAITLLSQNSLNRPWINIELGIAWSLNLEIVPLCLNLRVNNLPQYWAGALVCMLDTERDCIALVNFLLRRVNKEVNYTLTQQEVEDHGRKLIQNINEIMRNSPHLSPHYYTPPPKRMTVWFFGSYSGLSDDEKRRVQFILSVIALGFTEKGIRIVMGKSDMLIELGKKLNRAIMGMELATPNTNANPVMLLGKIRERKLEYLFLDAINTVPDLAVFIGGDIKGRVKEEYDGAVEAHIPIVAICIKRDTNKESPSTANKAKDLYGTLDKPLTEPQKTANAILEAVDRYSQ
jgi:hypothetical protein